MKENRQISDPLSSLRGHSQLETDAANAGGSGSGASRSRDPLSLRSAHFTEGSLAGPSRADDSVLLFLSQDNRKALS